MLQRVPLTRKQKVDMQLSPWKQYKWEIVTCRAHHVLSERLAQDLCHRALKIGTANACRCRVEKVQSDSQLVHILPQPRKLLKLLPSHLVAKSPLGLTDGVTYELDLCTCMVPY